MTTIRERDAADWGPMHEVVTGYKEACLDRRTLLAALDALVEAARALADEMTDHGDPLAAEFGYALRDIIATAKEASDG